MVNEPTLIPERVREHPSLMGYNVPEAQIVSVEPLIAREEEAPLPFIEANSAAGNWRELTEERFPVGTGTDTQQIPGQSRNEGTAPACRKAQFAEKLCFLRSILYF